MAADLRRQVAFHDLAVVQVHLHLQVRRADALDDRVRVGLGVQQVAGEVARVDRLDQRVEPVIAQTLRGPGDVVDVGLALRDALALAPTRPAIRCTRGQPSAFAYSIARSTPRRNSSCRPGRAGDTPLPAGPVPRRCIDQHLLQAVPVEFVADRRRAELVGELALDRLEAVGGAGAETLEERHLVVHHRQVGGEMRHGESGSARGS